MDRWGREVGRSKQHLQSPRGRTEPGMPRDSGVTRGAGTEGGTWERSTGVSAVHRGSPVLCFNQTIPAVELRLDCMEETRAKAESGGGRREHPAETQGQPGLGQKTGRRGEVARAGYAFR